MCSRWIKWHSFSVCLYTLSEYEAHVLSSSLEKVYIGYTYRDCLAEVQCNPPSVQRFLGCCDQCPASDNLHTKLEAHFEEQMIDRIEYKQWTTTDRSTLETKVQSVAIPKVLLHDFIANNNRDFCRRERKRLHQG